MSGESFTTMDRSLARIAEATWPFRLVLQRLPIEGETQTDERGFPTDDTTDLQATGESIPCMFIARRAKETIIDGKVRSATIFGFTIPKLYKTATGEYAAVDFSDQYKVKLLGSRSNAEKSLEIISGDKDPGPVITFDAIEFEKVT